MTGDPHIRAKDFLVRRHVEPLAADDDRWLNAHLAQCGSCAASEHQLNESLSALRTLHLDLPRNLASRTQFRVRMRADELRERDPAKKLVWGIAAVSWALGVGTAPWVWHAIEWIGQATGAPKLLLQAGFALWWTVPPLIAAWAALTEKRVVQQEQPE